MMKIYAWGANSNGQCGLGFTSEQISKPTEVPIVFPSPQDPNIQQTLDDYPDARVVKIDGGSMDTIILVENVPFGQPFEWQPNFQLLPYPKIRDIACGWDFSLYLSDDGVLHSRGNNSHCQLGRRLGAEENCDLRPPKSSQTWGNNLGSGDEADRSRGLHLTKVAAGLRHGVVTNSNDELLVWGHNSQNQIGPSVIPGADNNEPGVPMKLVESPRFATLLDFPAGPIYIYDYEFTHIACGKDFTVAFEEFGYLYGCGANKYGTMCHAPQDVKGFQGFANIFEKIPNKFFPGEIGELKCGWGHVLCLLDTGTVVSWGRNDLGQLGRESINPKFDVEPKAINFPEIIVSIACGSEHSLALGKSGTVYSWGWNEHDNCGVPNQSNANELSKDCIPFPVKVDIPCGGNVAAIGCGAGSSYAVTSV